MQVFVYVINYKIEDDLIEFSLNRNSNLNQLSDMYFNLIKIPDYLQKNKFNFFVNNKIIIDYTNILDNYLCKNDNILEIIVLYDSQNIFDNCNKFITLTDYKILNKKYYLYCSSETKMIDIKKEYSDYLKKYNIEFNPYKIRLQIYAKETLSENSLETYAQYQNDVVFNLLI